MKRIQPIKLDRRTMSRMLELKKPFGFCCDINCQDPETQYDMRNPPFESAFPETEFENTRPEVKFRVQDTVKTSTPTALRAAIFREDVEIKKAATYGKSKKGRGPLEWFLEEEIEAAREFVAEEKKAEYKERQKKIKKKVKMMKRLKKHNVKHTIDINELENTEELKSNDLEENKDKVTNNQINNLVDTF